MPFHSTLCLPIDLTLTVIPASEDTGNKPLLSICITNSQKNKCISDVCVRARVSDKRAILGLSECPPISDNVQLCRISDSAFDVCLAPDTKIRPGKCAKLQVALAVTFPEGVTELALHGSLQLECGNPFECIDSAPVTIDASDNLPPAGASLSGRVTESQFVADATLACSEQSNTCYTIGASNVCRAVGSTLDTEKCEPEPVVCSCDPINIDACSACELDCDCELDSCLDCTCNFEDAGETPDNIIYVDCNVENSGDGSSWPNAKKTLQEGIDAAADNSDIWVAQGRYVPNGAAVATISDKSVRLYGGFLGNAVQQEKRETRRSQRSVDCQLTVIDGTGSFRCVVVGESDNSLIDGFRVTNGSQGQGNGGGLIASNTNKITLRNVCFDNNTAGLGAGLFGFNSTINICTCLFDKNTAFVQGGGAIVADFESVVSVCGTTFTCNVANGTGEPPAGQSVGSGGAILNSSSTVNVSRCTFTNNSAVRAGGAIEATNLISAGGNATTNIDRSTFDRNTAIAIGEVPASPGNGGAIHYTGENTTSLVRCEFSSNLAENEGGAVWTGPATIVEKFCKCVFKDNKTIQTQQGLPFRTGGGAIFMDSAPSPVTICNSEFECNSAGNSSGGAIRSNLLGSLTLKNCQFTKNVAITFGSAIDCNFCPLKLCCCTFIENKNTSCVACSNLTLQVCSCLFKKNTIAITILFCESATIINSKFIENKSLPFDPSLFGSLSFSASKNNVVAKCHFERNQAVAAKGGAISNIGSDLVVSSCTFVENSATVAGGAIDSARFPLTPPIQPATKVCNSKFTNNFTSGTPGNGGAIHYTDQEVSALICNCEFDGNSAQEGGAVWTSSETTLQLQNSRFSNNKALGEAPNTGGGALFNQGGVANASFCEFDNNIAIEGSGSGGSIFNAGTLRLRRSTISRSSASRAGGALESNLVLINDIPTTPNTFISLCRFENNRAGSLPGNGGAIHYSNSEDDALIEDCVFSCNVATREGGAVWFAPNQTVSVTSTTFRNNDAQGSEVGGFNRGGGAVFNNGAVLSLSGCVFDENTASGDTGSGGAVFNSVAGQLNLCHCSFNENSAKRAGGAIEHIGDTLTVCYGTFDENNTGSAPGNGGAVHCNNFTNATLHNCSFDSNDASKEGGALWFGANDFEGASVRLANLLLTNNTALVDGGALFFTNTNDAIVEFSTFTSNSAAEGRGGAITLSDASQVLVQNSILYGDSAPIGSEISVAETSVLHLNSVIVQDATSDGIDGTPQSSTNVKDSDPFFVDPFAHNYRLQDCSAARDCGTTPVANVLGDLDGLPRIVGAAADLGAYESQGGAANKRVQLRGKGTSGECLSQTAVTDENGTYTFSALAPGKYAVSLIGPTLESTCQCKTVVVRNQRHIDLDSLDSNYAVSTPLGPVAI